MAVLRFPNAASDLDRMVAVYRELHGATAEQDSFDLDAAVQVLIESGQVSSSGAIGAEALRRSTRPDRSRDPLYNQLKMYSEIYRMLGWLHPSERRLEFHHTLLGEHVIDPDSRGAHIRGLLQECLLGIVFPNPNTKNIGIQRLRFFPLLLRFIRELSGVACRDEMIVGLYAITNDSSPDVLQEGVEHIRSVRGDMDALRAAVEATADENEVQVNTLHNYTRFPLGALRSPLVNWATAERTRDLYGRSVQCYRLIDAGFHRLTEFSAGWDIRSEDIVAMDRDSRAFLVNVGFYSMLYRAGFPANEQVLLLERSMGEFADATQFIAGRNLREIYFSPYQQAAHMDIDAATDLWSSLEGT